MLIVAAMVAIATPITAHAQERVIVEEHITTGLSAAPLAGGIISESQRPRLRRYIVEEQVPSYNIDQPIAVGAVLPDSGIIYYDVPQEFGQTTYRYTVVNHRTILVDPRTRRVMQVIE